MRSTVGSPAAGWCHFTHGADIGVCGFGPTRESAFEQGAAALMAAITDEPVAQQERVRISCEAPDDELLFVEWLNALIFEMATRHMLFGAFSVTILGHRLEGEASGERIDPARHRPAVEVKGATYTALKVTKQPDGLWLAQCVVDV